MRRVSVQDVPGGLRTVTRIKVPKGFNGRNAPARRDLAARLRDALPDDAGPVTAVTGAAARGTSPPGTTPSWPSCTAALRAHPCHACPDREEHARWAERWDRLRREHDALVARIEGRTSSIARVFDRICDVLQRLGYLSTADVDPPIGGPRPSPVSRRTPPPPRSPARCR